MKMNDEKFNAFSEMMAKELDKLGCSICYKTDTDVNMTGIDIYHSMLGPKHYLVEWDKARSLTEAAVPILSDVKMQIEVKKYCDEDIEQTKNLYYGLSLTIKDVIFNPPATIVFWMDGTKTVVKDQGEVFYDPEKGMAMAVAKKAFGNQGNYYNQFSKYLDIYEKKQEAEFTSSYANTVLDDIIEKFRNSLTKTNYNTVSNEKRTKIDTKIIFEHRNDALVALSNLKDIFDRYGAVCVGDLYDEAGIKCDYMHNRFGWKNHDDIHNAKIVKVKGGYMIDLPEPVEFD